MFISIKGYGQCPTNEIVFVDSVFNKLDSSMTDPVYVFNNGKDTLSLDQLFSMDLTKHPEQFTFGYSLSIDSIRYKQKDTTSFCVLCMRKDIKVIDSIDINGDGLKELFIFREWYCSAYPKYPKIFPPDEYGWGGQQQNYSKYEVWDVKNKNKIFEVKNQFEIQRTESVSVVSRFGYSFEVQINNEGNLILSNNSNRMAIGLEMGTYIYDFEAKTYKKE